VDKVDNVAQIIWYRKSQRDGWELFENYLSLVICIVANLS